ncbi:unnamed protein product [Albugo candida]|uniref:Uncharacterized protein n=1 Tax=Albugo candida TaxID=65357 RepID=A0A024GIF9_9STRA|nr:unnamed protein product [Albugo candida]|eukprot:CCI46678.1 unnamed protein product [Albugo candida]
MGNHRIHLIQLLVDPHLGVTIVSIVPFPSNLSVHSLWTDALVEFFATVSHYPNHYGHIMQTYLAIISFRYRYLSLAFEFTCVGQLTSILSPYAKPIVAILTAAITTNSYQLEFGGSEPCLGFDVSRDRPEGGFHFLKRSRNGAYRLEPSIEIG